MSGLDFLNGQNSGAIKIIHEPSAAEPFVVLEKPAGLPSAPLVQGEPSALTECGRLFPQALNVRGKKTVEGGLLHRIDTATSGLLLISTSQDFYDHIWAAQENGLFAKGYRAECDIDGQNAAALGGFPKAPVNPALLNDLPSLRGLKIASLFRPFGKGKKETRPVSSPAALLGLASDSGAALSGLANDSGLSGRAALKKVSSGRLYSTRILSASSLEGGALVECQITQGYRHQVRAHLAWLGLPVKGDALYNANYRRALNGAFEGPMRFYAVSLEFPDLFSNKAFRFSL